MDVCLYVCMHAHIYVRTYVCLCTWMYEWGLCIYVIVCM